MQSKINRRQFIQKNLMASAGLMTMPSFISIASAFQTYSQPFNANLAGLTPIALIDSACLLAFCTGSLSQQSQNALSTDIHRRNTAGNKGRLAGILPTYNTKLFELIETVGNHPETKHCAEKIAIAFGWTAINALERNVNWVFKDKKQDDLIWIRMHQDALLIRGFSSPEFDVTQAQRKDIENMLQSVLVRTITRTHTLKPDMQDGIGWVNRMAQWRQKNQILTNNFAKAIVNPNPGIAGAGFYNPNDEIILIANQIQKSQTVEPSKITNCLTVNNQYSDFAKALAEATNNILAIDVYFQGNSSKDVLLKKLGLI